MKYPWVTNSENRKIYAEWIFKNVICDEDNPNNFENM